MAARSSTSRSGETLTTYVDLMKAAGPPGASSNGFNENLALFNAGKCAMWIDATVAASFVTNPRIRGRDRVGFALAPNAGLGKETPNCCGPGASPFRPARRRLAAAGKFIALGDQQGLR